MVKLPDFPGEGPVLMLNLLRFKDRKHYFDVYLPAFKEVTAILGLNEIRIAMVSDVAANILASEDDKWDAFMLVEYPSATAFKTVAESEAYHNIAEQHRLAALSDLKLFMTRRSA